MTTKAFCKHCGKSIDDFESGVLENTCWDCLDSPEKTDQREETETCDFCGKKIDDFQADVCGGLCFECAESSLDPVTEQ